jgi:hypothetical protein
MPEPRILLDPLNGRWRGSLEERGLELDTVRAVVDPGSARLDELASRDHRGVAEDGDQVALAAGFDTLDAEAVLVVVEGDALDQTGQDLGRGARPGWPHHPRKMNVENRTCYRDQAPLPLPVGALQRERRGS